MVFGQSFITFIKKQKKRPTDRPSKGTRITRKADFKRRLTIFYNNSLEMCTLSRIYTSKQVSVVAQLIFGTLTVNINTLYTYLCTPRVYLKSVFGNCSYVQERISFFFTSQRHYCVEKKRKQQQRGEKGRGGHVLHPREDRAREDT